MKRKDIDFTREDILASFDRNGIKYVIRDDHDGCKIIGEDGVSRPIDAIFNNEEFLRSELRKYGLTCVSLRAKYYRSVNKYDDLHRKNANRKKTLKQLNKAIIRKNERIAELEEANKELTKFITTFKFSPFDFMFKYTNGNEPQ